MRKYKMTGCARFFLVLIVLAPLAYIGASYAKGEDGIANFKNLIGLGDTPAGSGDESTYDNTSGDLRKELEERDRKIRRLEKENDDLQEQIDALEAEIEALKAADNSGGE